MIKQLAFAALEEMLNQVVTRDPCIHQQMHPLYGKVVAIEITDLGLLCYFGFDPDRLTVQSALIGSPDLTLRGELANFVKMGLHYQDDQLPTGIKVLGEIALAQQLQRFMAIAKIDWEEIAAQLTGDWIATRLGRWVRRGQAAMKRQRKNLCQNTSEFLQYETQRLPSRIEVENFCRGVDQLRDEAARLEAHFHQLQVKLAARANREDPS